MRPVEGGWQWKFDRGIFAQFAEAGSIRASALPYLPQVRCRLALLRSENGLVTARHRRRRCTRRSAGWRP